MNGLYIALIVFTSLIVILFTVCYVCFRLTFYMSNKQKASLGQGLPPGKAYQPYYDLINSWREEAKTFKQEWVSVTSYDGLTLRGRYYEFFKGAPLEIMFHGYRGSADRDLCGGLQRCRNLKRNVLLVDQRAHGKSDGHVITFGIKERYDVKTWTEYAYNRFGKDVKIMITGISMGASTVLTASSLSLPESVVGIVADCGFNSPREIIKTVVKNMHLPACIFYPLIKLGAIIFGGFNPDKTSAEKELKNCKLPVIFIHGDSDDFVPCEMSKKNYQACNSIKAIEIFEGAGHGASFLVDADRYVKVLRDFQANYNM